MEEKKNKKQHSNVVITVGIRPNPNVQLNNREKIKERLDMSKYPGNYAAKRKKKDIPPKAKTPSVTETPVATKPFSVCPNNCTLEDHNKS